MKRYQILFVFFIVLFGTFACSSRYRTEFEELGGDQLVKHDLSKGYFPYTLALTDISMNRSFSGGLLNDLKAKIESAHVFKRVELGPKDEHTDVLNARLTIFDSRVDRRGLRPLEGADHPEAYEGAFIEHRYQLIVHWPKGQVGVYEAKCGGLLEGHGPMDPESQEHLKIEADHCLNAVVNKLVSDVSKMLGNP